MSRIEALLVLVRDAQADTISVTSCRRVLRAIKVLGLTREEKKELLSELDYCDYDGTPGKEYAEVLNK